MPFIYFWMLLEIVAFILVGQWIGFGWTLLILVVSSLLGFMLLRTQTFEIMKRMQDSLQRGQPMSALHDEAPVFMLAGIFLIIPGLLLNILALFFLLPGAEHYFMRRVMKRSASKAKAKARPKDDGAIDAEFWEEKKDSATLDNKNNKD